MKKGRYKYHYTRIPLYLGGLHVLVATDMAAAYQLAGYGEQVKDEDPNAYGGMAWQDTRNNEWGVYCLLPPDAAPSTVAHEALHLLTYLMKRKGLRYDADNDESLAYLMGWLVQEITYALTSKRVRAKKTFRLC